MAIGVALLTGTLAQWTGKWLSWAYPWTAAFTINAHLGSIVGSTGFIVFGIGWALMWSPMVWLGILLSGLAGICLLWQADWMSPPWVRRLGPDELNAEAEAWRLRVVARRHRIARWSRATDDRAKDREPEDE